MYIDKLGAKHKKAGLSDEEFDEQAKLAWKELRKRNPRINSPSDVVGVLWDILDENGYIEDNSTYGRITEWCKKNYPLVWGVEGLNF